MPLIISSRIVPAPWLTLRSKKLAGQNLIMSNRRKVMKQRKRYVGLILIKNDHVKSIPSTSSITIHWGSCRPNSFWTLSVTRQAKVVKITTIVRIIKVMFSNELKRKYKAIINGSVAKEPTVPGAKRAKPVPKKERKRIDGFFNERFCSFVMFKIPFLCLGW